MKTIEKISNQSSGQAMILTTVMLGGLMLSATAIAGLLMFYQLRQANDAASSGRAIFAADAGLEAGLRCYYYGVVLPAGANPEPDAKYCPLASSDFSNGASYQSYLKFSFDNPGNPGRKVTGFVQDSFGFSGKTSRAARNVFSNQ